MPGRNAQERENLGGLAAGIARRDRLQGRSVAGKRVARRLRGLAVWRRR